jgi:hypothetical protein
MARISDTETPEGTDPLMRKYPSPGDRHRAWLAFAAVLALAAVFLVAVYLPTHGNIANVDGVYEAQVARSLLDGHGYETQELPLYAVYSAHQQGRALAPPWVNSLEFPLPILVQVPLLAASGSSLFAATTGFSAACFLAAIGVLYWLAYALFGRLRPTVIATALTATNPLLLTAGLSGKGDSLDLLLFVVGLWLLVRSAAAPGSSRRTVAWLGVVTGLSFLAMFSEAIFMGIAFSVVLAWTTLKAPGGGWPRMARTLALYVGGAVLAVVPVLVAFEAFYREPLPSGNLLLQLVSYTPSVKYMNPWWKLAYPPQADNLYAYVGAYSGQLGTKLLVWGGATVWIFLGLGVPYLLVPFTPVSVWWLPVGFAFFLARPRAARLGLSGPNRRLTGIAGWVVASNLGLSVALLSLLSGTVEYVEYLLPLVFLIGALGLDEALSIFSRWMAARRVSLVRSNTADPTGPAPSSPRRTGLRVLISRIGVPVGVAVLLLLPASVSVGLIPLAGAPVSIAPNWFTDQDPHALALLQSITGPGQVVVTAEPWNVAWYDHRNALALPEYPDDVYTLLGLGLNVSAVYVANLNAAFFQDVSAPYSYDAYVRAATYGYSMDGFSLVYGADTPLGPTIVLEREPGVPLASLLSTSAVPFGSSINAGHLVWGWGSNVDVDGSAANWAGDPGGLPPLPAPGLGNFGCGGLVFSEQFCLPPVPFTVSPGVPLVPWQPSSGQIPQAEVTFLVNGSAPSSLVVDLLSPVSGQYVGVVLNANLVSFGQVGTLVGVHPVGPADRWTNLTFSIPPGTLVQGVNVIDFFFETSVAGGGGTGGLSSVFAAFHQLTLS